MKLLSIDDKHSRHAKTVVYKTEKLKQSEMIKNLALEKPKL